MIRVPSLSDETVAVLGLARSGLATCRALAASGAEVVAWDDDASHREAAEREGIELGDPSRIDLDGFAALVLSPGVPFTHPTPHPAIEHARAASVLVLGDVELLARSLPGRCFVGVTGTNGKSTTTALIGHVLAAAGHRVQVGGNIGRPVLDLDPMPPDGIYVLELSSFQLDLVHSLVCKVAVWLNLTPDHLDRHGDMAGYETAKRRLFRGQSASDWAVVGIDDDASQALFEELEREGRRRVLAISGARPIAGGIGVEDGMLIDDSRGRRQEALELDAVTALRGRHNHQNAAAAFGTVRALGLTPERAADAMRGFAGLAHRTEPVGRIGRVLFVNDSKATNPEAAAMSIAAFGDVYWIAGGRAKPGGFEALVPALDRVRHAFLIGEAAEELARAIDARVPVHRSGDLETAIGEAFALARDEGRDEPVVLLAPACASFDQFEDFEERGDRFREAARARGAEAPA
jgi:UDP-N-acetylmuramoylalanine--D-glutamate ligase